MICQLIREDTYTIVLEFCLTKERERGEYNSIGQDKVRSYSRYSSFTKFTILAFDSNDNRCLSTAFPIDKKSNSSDINRLNTHLFNAISIGIPGFTIAIFIYSVPRSIDITARLSTVNIVDTVKIRKILIIVFELIIFK
jgi:hypothetical protein